MPLFAFENGRAVPLLAPAARSAWEDGDAEQVRASVLDLVGIPLLPLDWQHEEELGSYLVALDATGAAVVVLVREELDDLAFVAALARSGWVRRAPWREVATWYPAGPDRLREDWAAFRESLPPRGEPAPALVLVVGSLSDRTRAAVEVLDTATVSVHEVHAEEREGRRMLAVEPVAVRLIPRHVVLEARVEDAPEVELIGGVAAVPDGVAASGARAREPEPEDPGVDARVPGVPDGDAKADGDAPEPEAEQPAELSQDTAPLREEGREDAGSEPEPRTAELSMRRAHRALHAQASASPSVDANLGLRTVAALVGESELVLDGSDGAVRAVLTSAGLIVVNGTEFDDPAKAANAVGPGAPGELDGWAAWRFGEGGPYLGEALEEASAPARRRHPRPRRRRAVRP